jgi:hypothetical protein
MSENNSTSNPKKKISPFKKKSPAKTLSNDYIDERLRSIYKGEDGKIPNMKKGSEFWKDFYLKRLYQIVDE